MKCLASAGVTHLAYDVALGHSEHHGGKRTAPEGGACTVDCHLGGRDGLRREACTTIATTYTTMAHWFRIVHFSNLDRFGGKKVQSEGTFFW